MSNTVRLHDRQFRKLISSQKIQKAINEIAKKINKDYQNERPVFLAVLNGSFLFAADLTRKVNFECEISFIKVASYSGTKSTGKINTLIGLNEKLKGKSVVILEDIIDSGNTIEKVLSELKKIKPKHIRIATLLLKPNVFKKKIKLNYIGLQVPNDFLVGYGLDYDGLGRNLSDIYTILKP